MNSTLNQGTAPLKLEAATSAELMSPNPISLREDATVYDAIVLMTERGIHAAPVINEAGRPVGVVSVTDVLIHTREFADFAEHLQRGQAAALPADNTTVGDVMTPMVIAVDVDTPAAEVIRQMIDTKVHQIFVADRMGTLAGVITSLDVLRKLHATT